MGVVSIRVEGVSITIVGGNIAIEQTPAAAVVGRNQGLSGGLSPKAEAAATTGAVPASAVVGTVLPESPGNPGKDLRSIELMAALSKVADGGTPPVIDKPDRSPLGRNGLVELPGEAKPVPESPEW